MTIEFTFDADTHTYTAEGTKVPSVSQILQTVGLVDYAGIDPAVLRYAAERSTAVHLASQFWDEGDLDLESVDPLIAGYVSAWKSFRTLHPFTITASERAGIGDLDGMRFGMTLDRLVDFGDRRMCVLDIKCTTKVHEWAAIQLAAYAIGLAAEGTPRERLMKCRRAVVHLKRDGIFKFHEFKDPNDGDIFACALRIAHWKNGSYKENGR
jgi:hypothetical protein